MTCEATDIEANDGWWRCGECKQQLFTWQEVERHLPPVGELPAWKPKRPEVSGTTIVRQMEIGLTVENIREDIREWREEILAALKGLSEKSSN